MSRRKAEPNELALRLQYIEARAAIALSGNLSHDDAIEALIDIRSEADLSPKPGNHHNPNQRRHDASGTASGT